MTSLPCCKDVGATARAISPRRSASYADAGADGTVAAPDDQRPDPDAVYVRLYDVDYAWADTGAAAKKNTLLSSAAHFCCDEAKGECAGSDFKAPPAKRVACQGASDCVGTGAGATCGYWDGFARGNDLGLNIPTSYADVASLKPSDVVVKVYMRDLPAGQCRRAERMTVAEADEERKTGRRRGHDDAEAAAAAAAPPQRAAARRRIRAPRGRRRHGGARGPHAHGGRGPRGG